MKNKSAIVSIMLLVLMMSVVPIASAAAQTTSSMLYISSVRMDPEVLYPYEPGTISVTLANNGNQSVGVSNPTIICETVDVVKMDSWNTMSYIASGSTITYSFLVVASPPDSSHFALFTVETKDGDLFHYPLIIKVDSTDLIASISDAPSVFPLAIEKTVNLSIINPRAGVIDNVFVTASGSGIEVSPSQKYVTSLEEQCSFDVPFTVTASRDTNLTFSISYQSGDTDHSTEVVLPIIIGNDKNAAVPVVNNVALTTKGSYYDLTGDITNTGITAAKGLTITVGSPAQGTGTYAEYAIGSLASDDSGSFEVTFTTQDLSSVPLLILWKDSVGNDYRVIKNLNLGTATGAGSNGSATKSSGSTAMGAGGPQGMGGAPPGMGSTSLFSGSSSSGISSFYPVIAAGLLVVLGIVLYRKRTWIKAKFKKS